MKNQPHFIKVPDLRHMSIFEKDFKVELLSDLEYYSKILDSTIIVSSGFRSDGASIPSVFWSRLPPFGKYLGAAIIHDFYYTLGEQDRSPIDYKMATKVFREAMKVSGVNWLRRNLMYKAVIWFGPRFKAKDNT